MGLLKITVIEAYGLKDSCIYAKNETPEDGFKRIVASLFCAEEIYTAKDAMVCDDGMPVYKVDFLATVKHERTFMRLPDRDTKAILLLFCDSVNVASEDTVC